MKVSIDHSEWKKGFIKKITHYVVALKVELSEEEKKIIKERKLEEVVILESASPSHNNGTTLPERITFATLMYGENSWASTLLSDSKIYEVKLIEALKQAKVFLQANESVQETSKSFEL